MKSKMFSTLAVAHLLGVSDQSVANWIDAGSLRAGRTPGGHRRVYASDLIDFLKRQKLRIPPELGESSPTILAITDHIGKLMTPKLRAALSQYRVLDAGNCFVAGQVTMEERPDLIVLDVDAHNVDAQAMCRTVKSDERTRHIAMVAVSSRLDRRRRSRLLAAGFDSCHPKPVETGAFVETIRSLLKAFL